MDLNNLKNKMPKPKPNNTATVPKRIKVHQPHWMLWLALIVMALPIGYIGNQIITAQMGQGQPVEGERYTGDLDPKIEQSQIDTVVSELKGIDGVEDVSANLISATLRVHIDVKDDMNEESVKKTLGASWGLLKETLPEETYFTNQEDVKMYDLEIDCYNFIVDDTEEHSQDKQIYIKGVKNAGAKKGHYDYMTKPKDSDLVKQIVREVNE